MKKYFPMLALVLVAGTACATEQGAKSDAAAGNNRPSPARAEVSEPEPSLTKEEESGPVTFGDTFTYENGVSVTVTPAKPFTPSETAAFTESPAYVSFQVTVVNGSTANFDPNLIMVSLQSANVEADEVFDSEKGVGGTPSTTVLPGRETTFAVAFGVADPADLVMETAPGFEYDAAIFTS